MALLTQSLALDAGAVLLALLVAVYLFVTRRFGHWKKKGIPCLEPIPFVGNFKPIVLGKASLGVHLSHMYKEAAGNAYIGMFAFDQPMLLIRDLDLIKHVLVKDFNYFANRCFSPNEKNDPMLAKNLFGLATPRWRHLRVKMTPTFTSGKMKVMFDLVNECGKDLAGFMEDQARAGGHVEVKEAMARYTTDVIATCAFGIQCNSLQNPDAEFRRILKTVFEFSLFKSIKMTAAFFAPRLVSAFNWRIMDWEVTEFLRSVVWSTVDYREKNGVVRRDFLDLMMQIRSKGRVDDDTNGHSKTNNIPEDKFGAIEGDDFVAQAFVFLAAGFETSSSTLSFALYELATHPEIQGRLRAEIHSVLDKSGGQVTYEGVQKMEYLDRVMAETLRMYPILSFLDRRVLEDYRIPDSNIVLEKGTAIMISVLGIHWDPQFYPEPARFDPERFTEENNRKRPNYTYLPFGEGPRNCIGSRMGQMQVKVGLAHILSQFEVFPCKETPVPLKLDPKIVLLNAMGGLPLALHRVA